MAKITTIHSQTELWEGYLKNASGLKADPKDYFQLVPID